MAEAAPVELAAARCCPKTASAKNGNRSVSLCFIVDPRGNASLMGLDEDANDAAAMGVQVDPAWDPDDQCADGYKGPLCMDCDVAAGYLRQGHDCNLCAAGPSNPMGAAMFVMAV